MELDFKTRLKRRKVLLGPIVTLGSTEVAEILSKAGFDWLWIEMEHAPNGLARVQEMIQAAGGAKLSVHGSILLMESGASALPEPRDTE